MSEITFEKFLDFLFDVFTFVIIILFMTWGAQHIAASSGIAYLIGWATAIIVFVVKKAESRIMAKLREQDEKA